MTILSDHDCPVDGCLLVIPFELLMCRAHWYTVPLNLRKDVSYFWRTAPGSPAYRLARDEAIRYVNDKIRGGGHD